MTELLSVAEGDAETLRENDRHFRRLVDMAEARVSAGSVLDGLVLAEMAALTATWQHTGAFASPDLEGVLARIAPAPRPESSSALPRGPIRRVLHVSTFSRLMGGVSQFVPRWIQLDAERTHDVALTRQGYVPLPSALSAAVKARGGRIHRLDTAWSGLAGQVARLRALASEADLVVLHVETDDALPLLAFTGWQGSPVVTVNHADHAFWLGVTIIDAVISLRRSGAELTTRRRGVQEDRSLILPTVLDVPTAGTPRHEAKAALGLPADAVLMVSVARAPKFESRGGVHFMDLCSSVLGEHEEAHVIVVGPERDGRWDSAMARFPGRVQVVPETPDTAQYLDAADIYLDSFPFASITSLLEAGAQGIPVTSFSPWSPQSAIFECGAPGLDGVLVMSRGIRQQLDNLERLIRDRAHREELGRRTQVQIVGLHTGSGWCQRLEEVYSAILQLPERETTRLSVPRCFEEPDTLVSAVFGTDPPLWDHLQLRLGVLPFTSRLAAWLSVRESGHGSLLSLVPEPVTAGLYSLRDTVKVRT